MELCLRFNKSEITHWAKRYTECQNLRSRKNEKNLIGREICIQRKGFMTLNELETPLALEVSPSIKAS